MAIVFQVSDVREELFRAAGGRRAAGSGRRSNSLLGQIFHRVFASLVADDSGLAIHDVLADRTASDADWHATLVDHAYRCFIERELTRHQAALQDATTEVLDFWMATKSLCEWLGDLYWTAIGETKSSRGANPFQWSTLAELIVTERSLSWELREPGWSDTVQLVGAADAVFRLPGQDTWMVIELKLGQSFPEVDLGQACLYHHMLASLQADAAPRTTQASSRSIALVSFTPKRRESLFQEDELEQTRVKLIELIGRMAGMTSASTARSSSEPVMTASSPSTDRTSPLEGDRATYQEMANRLVQAFREYGAGITLDGEPIVSPAFLRFPVQLERGVKVNAVKSRGAEVQIRLELDAPPMISVAEGRVVIDVQRPDREYIPFSSVHDQLPQTDDKAGSSRVLIGVDLNGRLQFADFAEPENAHLLVAGTTGSGKTEWLRTAIASLIATNSPATLRLVLIDPKRNAFHSLRDSPFLHGPIVFPDEQPVVDVLESLVSEMDARYRRMGGADSLKDYLAQHGTPLPRIVCVCDEYADLIQRSRQERQAIEAQIIRLGAKARAAGIHLVLATQQPSRETIRGALDSNIPARVGLKMQNAIESRMLLGKSGAEHLLGNGDLLFKDIGPPRRMQAAWIGNE